MWCLESYQCCGQSTEIDQNKLHIGSSSDPVIIPTLVEYLGAATVQSCEVRTVLICCNAFYTTTIILICSKYCNKFWLFCLIVVMWSLYYYRWLMLVLKCLKCTMLRSKEQKIVQRMLSSSFMCTHDTIICNWRTCMTLLPKLSGQNLDIPTKSLLPYFPAHKTHFFLRKMWPKLDLRLMRRG